MPCKLYDCSKCPGYCCSYPVIEVKGGDARRIARHFGISLKAAEKYFKPAHGYKRVMRRKMDTHFGRICRFFDIEARRCTIYEARPATCRVFPGGARCGYWDFLKFERGGQKDEDYVSTTDHSGN
ncbi:MAG: YkgJ family cysteine cluster protein [Hyphomicrobiales bacterium]